MKKVFPDKVEKHRELFGVYGTLKGNRFGAFHIPWRNCMLQCVVCSGEQAKEEHPDMPNLGWDHVSVTQVIKPGVSLTPTWEAMDYIKNLFWDEEELVIQYHMPRSQHININNDVLHMWKPLDDTIPTPPSWMV